jgi:hypothetical protein
LLVKQKMAMRSLHDLVTTIAHMLPRRQMTTPYLADILSQTRLAAKASQARKNGGCIPCR